MKKRTILLFTVLFTFLFATHFYAQVIYSEDFESGSANVMWHNYYALYDTIKQESIPEENVVAVPMASVPIALTGGGNYVGWLQDVDSSFNGSGVAVAGPTTLANYSIEGDVYCYVNNPGGSAYTGLVVYADSSKRDFYKLRVDFDASDRINFSGLKSDTVTFLPKFSKDFKGVDNPGLFPTSDGWHKMKIEVRATGPNETSFWCYFDGTLLTGSPIKDTNSTRNTSGGFGLYAFQNFSSIPGYFDNIVVKQLQPITAVEDLNNSALPDGYYLSQNYPNPFNPTTNISYQINQAQNVSLIIYDILGEKVKTLVSQYQSPGQYTITWNGQNDVGNKVISGVYIYTLKTGDVFLSKKMLMLK